MKNYDCVKEMRKVRDKLSLKYYKNTDLLFKDLESIRKKYNLQPSVPSKRSKSANKVS